MKSNKRPERFTESQVQNQEFLSSTQPSKIDRIRSSIHPKVNVLPPNSLPLWKDYPLDKKFPKVPANDDKFVFARNQIGQSVFVSSPRQKFDNEDPTLQATPKGYTSLHDPHLKEYFEKHPKVFDRLVKEGLVDPEDGGVKTDMKAFNEYRAYLARLRNTELDDEVRTQNKYADAQNQQLKRIKTDATNSDRKRKHEQKAQALNALKRDRAARELRNQLKEFKQANGMVAAEKARQDAEAALKREMLRDKVRGRLAKLRRAERRRARKLILEFYCKQLYADMLRNAIREHKKKERHADLESFVDAKREFQTVKMEYMKALEEKRKAEKECHVNARMKHFEHVENHRIENLKKRVMQAQRAAEREAYLLRKFGMRWLNAVRQQRDNAKTYHESVWHVRQQLMVMVKELKKESGKVSFTNFIHGLVSLRPGAAEPLPKMSEETKAIMNYILDLLIQTALEEYKKQHEKCKEAYAKQARRRDILGKPHLTEKDFEPPPYSPREKPVIPFERPTFPCKHPCTDIKPWMKEHGTCNECEENEDEYDEAYDMVDEELRRIMGIATPREQEAIREIVGSDSSGEAEGVVSSSIKKSVEKLAREGISTKDVSSNTRPQGKQTRKPQAEVRQERAAPKEKAKPVSTPPSSDSSAVAEQAAKLAIKNSLAKLAEEPTESEGSSAVAEKVVSKSLTNVQADLEKPKEPEVLRKSEVEEKVEPNMKNIPEEEPLETHEPEEEQQEAPKDDVSEGSSGVAEELVRKSLSNVTSGMLKESASKLVEQPPAQQDLEDLVKEPLKEPVKEEVEKLDEPGERLSAQEAKPDDRAADTEPTAKDDTPKEEVLKQEPVKQADKEQPISPEEKERKPEESNKEPEESKLSDKKPVDKEEQQEKQAPDEAKATDQKLDKPPIDQQQDQPTEAEQQDTDQPQEDVLRQDPRQKQETQAPDEAQKEETQAPEEAQKEETQAPEEALKEETQAPEEAQAPEEPPKQDTQALEEEEPVKEGTQSPEETLRQEPPKEEVQALEEALKEEPPKEEAQSPEESVRQEPQKEEAQALEEAVMQDPDKAESPEESQREEPEKRDPEPTKDEHPTEDTSKPDDQQPVARDNEPVSKESEKKDSIQESVDDSTDKLVNESTTTSQDSSKRETLDESSKQHDSELEPEEDESANETDATSQDGAKPDDAEETDDAIQEGVETQDSKSEGREEDDTPNQYLDEEQIPETQTSQPDQHAHELPDEKEATYEEEREAEPSESVMDGRSLEPLDSCTSYASTSSTSSTASNLVSRSLQNAADSLKCKEAPVQSSTQEINYDSCGEPSSTGSSSTSDPSDIVKKSILKAVESLTCKELDSCDSLSELSVSSGEAEGIVAKALARVVESLRCGSQGDGPEHLTRIRKSSEMSHDTVQAYQMGGYVHVQKPGQDTLDRRNSQARSQGFSGVGQTGSGQLGPQGRALQSSGDPQTRESRASQAYFPENNTTGVARASGPPQRTSQAANLNQGFSQARNIGQVPSHAANLRQASYQATSLDEGPSQARSFGQGPSQAANLDQGLSQARSIGQGPYQAATLDKGPFQAANLTQSPRRNEPGVVHRYETGLIESGDCDSVINEMAKAVVKSILPQGLFTRYSFTDESVTETQPPVHQSQSPATQPEAAVMPQDLRDSVLRTLSNVQEQLDAIRHELQIHGVIP